MSFLFMILSYYYGLGSHIGRKFILFLYEHLIHTKFRVELLHVFVHKTQERQNLKHFSSFI